MKIGLSHLTKTFPSRNKKDPSVVTAVSDLTFEIPDGQLIGLLGPSGCGKSTTLNMICGLEQPSSGTILFGERDVTHLPPECRGVGMVFQNYALYPHLTVRQNIRFPLENLKGKERPEKAELDRRVAEAAALVQITELMERRPAELSGGQQQRVAIARALVKTPDVLLLDEPLSNLDARLRLKTREEIRKIQRATKITTVFVTHDQEEAMSISDQIVVMKEGVLQQMGRPQEVYDNPANLFVAQFLGTPPIHVFDGQIRDGMIYVGPDAIMKAPAAVTGAGTTGTGTTGAGTVGAQTNAPANEGCARLVKVGVRPEGFLLREDGALPCSLDRVEVMGRDVSIVCRHPACENQVIRAIVNAEVLSGRLPQTVRFALKPSKVFLFDPQDGGRL